jgi:hypothetical protein
MVVVTAEQASATSPGNETELGWLAAAIRFWMICTSVCLGTLGPSPLFYLGDLTDRGPEMKRSDPAAPLARLFAQ